MFCKDEPGNHHSLPEFSSLSSEHLANCMQSGESDWARGWVGWWVDVQYVKEGEKGCASSHAMHAR